MLRPYIQPKNKRWRVRLKPALIGSAITVGLMSLIVSGPAWAQNPQQSWLHVGTPKRSSIIQAQTPVAQPSIIKSAEVAKFRSEPAPPPAPVESAIKKPSWLRVADPSKNAASKKNSNPTQNPFVQRADSQPLGFPSQKSSIASKSSKNAAYKLGAVQGKTVAGGLEFDPMDFQDLKLPENAPLPSSSPNGQTASPGHAMPGQTFSGQATLNPPTPHSPQVGLGAPPVQEFSSPDPFSLDAPNATGPTTNGPTWNGPSEVLQPQPSQSIPEPLADGYSTIEPNPETMHGPPESNAGVVESKGALIAPNVPRIPQIYKHGSDHSRLEPYRQRAMAMQDQPFSGQSPIAEILDSSQIPADGFNMWWEQSMPSSIGLSNQTVPVDIATLTRIALASSPYVRSILAEPRILQSEIVSADSEFDPTVFLEGRFTDTNEPVGSTLTTGDNSDRFVDQTLTGTAGVRRRTRQGGALELSQRAGFQDNNSTFLDPNPQGTTRLEFNFTQPLLRDRGRVFNNARILLAKLDFLISNAIVRQNLEDHLISVTQSYWELYQARAEWLQRGRLLKSAEHLHEVLQARSSVDSQKRQILRARVAVTKRRSELIRAVTRIQDAQAQLRLLTGSEQLKSSPHLELTPQDQPFEFPVDVSTRDSLATALENRADIAESLRKIQSISVRVGAAKNQVLPQLDLILGAYVAGIDGNRSSLRAFSNQFSDGRPTYWAGMVYELPVGNRGNKARLNRSRWEYAQAIYEFQQATDVAFTEIEIAARETRTAYNEMLARKQAIDAAASELAYLKQRWEFLPEPSDSAVLLIDNMLDSQERLADEESAFVRAQVAYALSWIQLRRATGVLLKFDQANQSVSEASVLETASNPLNTAISNTEIESIAEPVPSFETQQPIARDGLSASQEKLLQQTESWSSAPVSPPTSKVTKKPWWRFNR